jgi:hypothetical protein
MPVFYVHAKELHEVMYRVEAEFAEDAIAMVHEGDAKAIVEEDSFDSFLTDETYAEEETE